MSEEKKSNILNLKREYKQENYIFLGEPKGLYDTIHCHHPRVQFLLEAARSQAWESKEFDFSPCRKEFVKKDDAADVMLDTIGSQFEMDSSVANALLPLFAPFLSNSESTGLFAFNTNMECLHPDHEVFIKGKGWIGIKDAKIGDEVIQYNIKANALEFTPIRAVIAKQNSSGILYHFIDKHFEQITTPKHRMIYHTNNLKHNPIRFCEAEILPQSYNHSVLCSAPKIGSIDTLSWEDKFWIAFQADGHIDRKNNGVKKEYRRILFAFAKERKMLELENILDNCGFSYEITSMKDGKVRYNIKVPNNLFRDGGKSFSWVDKDNISSVWCQDFIKELSKWDSTLSKTGKDGAFLYANTNIEAIHTVMDIISFAGKRFKFGVRDVGYSIYQTKPLYVLYITNRHKKTTKTLERNIIPYTGMVYCVTVDSGAFLTKLNNCISITGNCIHAESYSEILRNGYPDPEEALNKIVASQETFERFSCVVDALEGLHKAGIKYLQGELTKEEAFPILYKGMAAVYLLERINFIASFAITFGLGEAGMYLPIANCVKKICSDEINIHAAFDEYILRHMREDMHYWQDWKDNKEFQAEIIELIDSTERDEERWTDFIFKDRTIVGLTPELVKDWVRFNVQMLKQSMDLPFEVKVKENPLPWMNNWLSLNKFQNAPQEIEKSDYAVGAMKDDLDDADFDA